MVLFQSNQPARICAISKSFVKVTVLGILLSAVATSQAQIPFSGMPGPSSPAQTSSALTPEILGMPRIANRLRRPHDSTLQWAGCDIHSRQESDGPQTLQFPPIDIRDYRFFLAFRETKSNVLIQDVVPDVYDYMVETGKGPHPLGLNFTPGTPLSCSCSRPTGSRTRISAPALSTSSLATAGSPSRISTKTNVAADADEIYMAVEIENRQADPLELVVSPDQRAPELTRFVFPTNPASPRGP